MRPILMTANSGANLEDVELGRPLLLEARQRCVANRSRQVRLTFLDRLGVVGRGHRVLAEAGIIQLFDVHERDVGEATLRGKVPVGHRLIVRQASLRAALARVLRKPVGDVVIVALLGDEDVHVEVRAGRIDECAHCDRDLFALNRVPEQG